MYRSFSKDVRQIHYFKKAFGGYLHSMVTSTTRKLQMIGQHGTIMPHMIDNQMINGSMINILSMFKFILLQ